MTFIIEVQTIHCKFFELFGIGSERGESTVAFFGGAVVGALKHTDYRILAIEHPFATPDAPCDLYAFHGIDADAVVASFET